MQTQSKNLLLIFFGLLFLVNTHMEVSNYDLLEEEFKDPSLRNISYSVANFGFAPYGKTMISNLVESPGLSTECTTNDTQYDAMIENSFLLIPRGQCQFVTKAIHAQELGAQMVIIMDNETHNHGVVMKDNGYGYKVKIPAIFIHYEDGQKLIKLLENTSNKIMLKVSFESVKTDKVDVVFYLEAFNRRSYALVKNFSPYFQKIQKNINFTVVHNVFRCGKGKCNQQDCYVDGQYCAVHYPHGLSANGQTVLDQQIRQDIILSLNRNQWWSYMNCIDTECNLISQVKSCSSKCMKKWNINEEQVEKKFNQSFDYGKSNNSILAKHAEQIRYSGIDIFPGVTLNNAKMKGSLTGEFIFDDICNTLTSPPDSCKKYIKVNESFQNYEYQDWVVILLSILGGAAIFALLFCLYRRHMKKKMANEMQGRVDDMVSKYISFYSERNNK